MSLFESHCNPPSIHPCVSQCTLGFFLSVHGLISISRNFCVAKCQLVQNMMIRHPRHIIQSLTSLGLPNRIKSHTHKNVHKKISPLFPVWKIASWWKVHQYNTTTALTDKAPHHNHHPIYPRKLNGAAATESWKLCNFVLLQVYVKKQSIVVARSVTAMVHG